MIVTASQMRTYDRRAIEEFGIPSLILMENAGRGLAEMVLRNKAIQRVLVICGKGNNGGDGFVAARHLINHNRIVTLALAADPNQLKGDALLNYEIIKKQVPVNHLLAGQDKPFQQLFKNQDAVIDALFGIGLNSPVCGVYAEIIDWINSAGLHTIAADIPSGIHADSGEVLKTAVRAHQTATFGLMKAGLIKGEGPHYAGEVEIIDIGLPKVLFERGAQTDSIG